MGCDGLDSELALFVLGIPGVVAWLLLAGSATAMIARRHPTRSAVWLAVAWCVPILGALCWFAYWVVIRASRRTTAG
ncbi:PLDc N-terminal domain-containing protein [Mycobacterium sp. E1747]|uniref:PLDc N-terminal domain-containing protein n=1 Tax=Mycobacterium sp. E1747 TaxID=1834128 RepID=UPI0007FF2304|nr:PLDc N-terminal domain-containing protein [Mycobacterium sp. E1747]OBH13066.1 hypothetical protein A5695_14900 [Mycobacterium sp. E1747]